MLDTQSQSSSNAKTSLSCVEFWGQMRYEVEVARLRLEFAVTPKRNNSSICAYRLALHRVRLRRLPAPADQLTAKTFRSLCSGDS